MGIAIKMMWMHHAYLRKLIVNWFRRSQGELVDEFTIFDKFVSLWISFNAWGTYQSQKDTDRQMIEWTKSNEALKERLGELLTNDSDFIQDISDLKNMCPIQRHKPYRGSHEVNITSINNFNEVLEAIYVMRCNLLHGFKDPEDIRNQTLIRLAFQILSKLFSEIVNGLSSSNW